MYNSNKYAKSLFDVSVKAKNALSVKKELQLIAYLFKKTSTFRLVFITKKIDLNQKVDIVNNALNMLSPLTLEFLTIIINNNYSNHLLNIISKFNCLASDSRSTFKSL